MLTLPLAAMALLFASRNVTGGTPVARFYGQPLRGVVTLPVAALAYLAR